MHKVKENVNIFGRWGENEEGGGGGWTNFWKIEQENEVIFVK